MFCCFVHPINAAKRFWFSSEKEKSNLPLFLAVVSQWRDFVVDSQSSVIFINFAPSSGGD